MQLKLKKRGLPDSQTKAENSAPALSDKEVFELKREIARDIIVAVIRAHSAKQKQLRIDTNSGHGSPKDKPKSSLMSGGALSGKLWRSSKTATTIYPTES